MDQKDCGSGDKTPGYFFSPQVIIMQLFKSKLNFEKIIHIFFQSSNMCYVSCLKSVTTYMYVWLYNLI